MNKVFKGVGVIFLLIGLFMVISTWIVYGIDSKIVDDNNISKAIVVKKYFVASADGDSDFMIEYYFTDKNQKLIKTSRGVTEELWNKMKQKDTIDILYTLDNSARNFPVGSGHTSIGLSIFVTVLGLIFTGFGLVVVFVRYEKK